MPAGLATSDGDAPLIVAGRASRRCYASSR
jgi:hypothetical protein